MQLSEETHPKDHNFHEKVLQFGTGVLLRGLCDYLIDKANKKGMFRGSIVVVKSMGTNISDFTEQNNQYTVCTRGVVNGDPVKENTIVSSISRVLTAQNDWEAILETAKNPDMQVVVSNTTEVGLQFFNEDPNVEGAPSSFPGKLTAWLKVRFEAGLPGVVIIPTELLVDNGQVLKDLILRQIDEQGLDKDFRAWVENENKFCSSLVDRIVPGKPAGEELQSLYKEIGYEDKLLIKAEAYRLWAIEGDDKVRDILSFVDADKGVVIDKDIKQYRELKLRVLNAPHTLMSGLSFLAGFETVKEALNDELMEKFITILMLTELAPALPSFIDQKVAQRYGREIIDRFRNPFLDHKWHSITFQYTMKLKMRAVPLLMSYYDTFGTVPHYFSRGVAAYLLFMKAVKEKDGKYYGELNGEEYVINDDQAAWYYEMWQKHDVKELTKAALSNEDFWEIDLTHLEGFEESVATHLSNMMSIGVKAVASALNVFA
ncbi:tagaturonate reductase [Jiulongibacter sp. NS-SX5]|uniref:tagaturonate reductase n=1 Tax=Jiulongibacter sp. NS-SX5 TaxID=3463854 RepID=UPI00405A493B